MIAPSAVEALQQVPRDQIPAVVAALLAKLVDPAPSTPEADPLLTADQVAERLQVDRKWVYRHKDKLGAISLSKKHLRFPTSGLERYLKRRGKAQRGRQ